MYSAFLNSRGLILKVVCFTLARLFLLRLFVEATFSFLPESRYANYATLDALYRDNLPPSLWGWGNFDGNHYIGIAMRGYYGYEHPFFPLYPRIIKFIADLGAQPLFSAEIVSFSAKIVAMLIIIRLLQLDGKAKLIWPFVFVLLFFPTSFFYSSAYNDSLFFLMATITIFFARKKLWVFSAIAASVATLTRLNGLVLLLFIVMEYLCAKNWKINWGRFSWSKLWESKIFLVVLIPLAFISYLIYTHLSSGSWTVVFTDMSLWGQDRTIFPLQVFWRYLKILVIYPHLTTAYFTALLELSFVLSYIFLLVIFFRRVRPSYWILFAVSILLPALTGTFQGMPRYGLHLYPFFLMITLFLEKKSPTVKIAYFVVSIALLLLLTTMFVHGYFIA